MLKEYHAGALDQAEARELVGSLFLVGPGSQFDPELDVTAGDVTTAPDDPLQGVEQSGEEQKHVVAGGEEQKHVVAGSRSMWWQGGASRSMGWQGGESRSTWWLGLCRRRSQVPPSPRWRPMWCQPR